MSSIEPTSNVDSAGMVTSPPSGSGDPFPNLYDVRTTDLDVVARVSYVARTAYRLAVHPTFGVIGLSGKAVTTRLAAWGRAIR